MHEEIFIKITNILLLSFKGIKSSGTILGSPIWVWAPSEKNIPLPVQKKIKVLSEFGNKIDHSAYCT